MMVEGAGRCWGDERWEASEESEEGAGLVSRAGAGLGIRIGYTSVWARDNGVAEAMVLALMAE